jgi:hypothetical protein
VEKLFEGLLVFHTVLTYNKTGNATFCIDIEKLKVYAIVLTWYFMLLYFMFSHSIFMIFSEKNHGLRAV